MPSPADAAFRRRRCHAFSDAMSLSLACYALLMLLLMLRPLLIDFAMLFDYAIIFSPCRFLFRFRCFRYAVAAPYDAQRDVVTAVFRCCRCFADYADAY